MKIHVLIIETQLHTRKIKKIKNSDESSIWSGIYERGDPPNSLHHRIYAHASGTPSALRLHGKHLEYTCTHYFFTGSKCFNVSANRSFCTKTEESHTKLHTLDIFVQFRVWCTIFIEVFGFYFIIAHFMYICALPA